MTQDRSGTRVTISREDLYRQVWETPMQRLAAGYGISGNGLAKICDRLNVPYPPRGYWAKREAGKPTRQVKLPAADGRMPSEVTIRATPPRKAPVAMSEEMQQKFSAALQATSGIAVAKNLRNAHPIVARWIEDRRGYMDRQSRAENELENRRDRILHTLFKQLEQRGFSLKAEQHHAVWVEIDGLRMDFKLAEHIRQIRRPLTPQEAKQRSSYATQQWTQEHIPSGSLVFRIVTPLEHGLPQKWMDAPDKPLEQEIRAIVATFILAEPILKERHKRAEEQRRQWAEQERLRREEINNQRRDENRWHQFLKLSKQWQEFQIARQFLTHIESMPPAEEPTAGGYTQQDWVGWLRANLDQLDPLSKGPGGLWQNLFEVSAWSSPD